MKPQRYRKKPIEIMAVRLTDNADEAVEIARWCGGKAETRSAPGPKHWPVILVDTLEGTMRADPGDWIIRGVEGEFYPCKHSVFDASYEKAS